MQLHRYHISKALSRKILQELKYFRDLVQVEVWKVAGNIVKGQTTGPPFQGGLE